MNYTTKFGDVNKEYLEFRPEYPDILFQTIESSAPRPFSKAVDLGAGTGISTIVLSKWFDEVYAVEPDGGMLKDVVFPSNVTACNCTGEDFECKDNTVQLVTSGNAFYWMNGNKVVHKIDKWLVKGGLFAAYRYSFPKALLGVGEIFDYELEKHWDVFRSERLVDEDYTYRTINNSGLFSKVDKSYIPNIKSLTPESIVGFFSSTSYGSAYIKTIDYREEYIGELVNKVKSLTSAEKVDVDFGLELVLAIK